MRGTPEQRFWAKVQKTDTCWLWTDKPDSDGYGLLRVNKHNVRAHRLSYELLVGPIPEGLTIDHLCRVRLCVRPDHLEPVPIVVNILRGDGWAARAARQTHCPQGHPYEGNNIMLRRDSAKGGRRCRICSYRQAAETIARNLEKHRAHAREYQRQKRAALRRSEVV